MGSHIAFAADQYAPSTIAGRQLIAHELTHVVQQSRHSSTQPVVQRQTGGGTKGGVETTEVSPEIERLLIAKGIPYAREVTFELLDANGKAVVKGRMDYFFRDPRTGQSLITEVKGVDLEALTANQKIYVPEFERGGATIRITSVKAGGVNLPPGSIERVRAGDFLRVGRGNLKDFADALEQATTGQRIKFSWRDQAGLRFFRTEEEFEAFLATKGITRVSVRPPAPVKAPPSEPARPASAERPTSTASPPSAEPTQAELEAKLALEEEALVERVAASQGLRVRSQGGFATIGGMKFTVLMLAGVYFLVQDVRLNGFVAAAEHFVVGTAIMRGIMALGRVSAGTASVVGLVLGMRSDNAKFNEQQERMELVDRLIASAFPGVVEKNVYCLRGIGWPCIDTGWGINDEKRYNEIRPIVVRLVEHPYELEQDLAPHVDLPVTEEIDVPYRVTAHEDAPPPRRVNRSAMRRSRTLAVAIVTALPT